MSTSPRSSVASPHTPVGSSPSGGVNTNTNNSRPSTATASESAQKILKRFREPAHGGKVLLGKGSFAEVIQALDLETGGLVAIKKMVIDRNRMGKEAVERIVSEVQTLKTAVHPNIIQYLAAGRISESELWIVMEQATGGSVARLLERYGPLPEQIVCKFMLHAATGLAYLHSISTAHRDLKAENLLLCDQGMVKLGDFGCAKQISEESDGMTGTLVGTPLFLAPEVALSSLEPKDTKKGGGGGGAKYDAFAADIWTLGITTVQCLAGKPPFNQLQWMQHCQKPDAEVPLPAGISPECTNFLKACLNRNPKERATINELLRMPFLLNPAVGLMPPVSPGRMGSAFGSSSSSSMASPLAPVPVAAVLSPKGAGQPGDAMSKALGATIVPK